LYVVASRVVNIGFVGAVYCLFGVVIPVYSKLRDKKMIKLGLAQKNRGHILIIQAQTKGFL
jgi:hypothetical protein